MDADKDIDCKGLSCPMPVLRVKKAFEDMKSGQVLKMLATDKGALHDIPAFAKRTGNELLEMKEEGDVLMFFLKKK